MKKNIFIAALIFIGISIFSACALEPENLNKGFYFEEQIFTSEWDAWENKNIQNYSFTLAGKLPHWNFNLSRAIFMHDYKVNIIVKNGVMDSFEYIGDAPREDDGESSLILEPEFTSISDMYQRISNMTKEERKWWSEYSGEEGLISTTYEIKYDSQLHYITFFEPVGKWESGWIVDTTAHAVTISNFTVLDDK
ncbi:MAG: hypothetical protein LBD58_02605 [Treponema sp.]|jgi:hypothetical protein|nr:hypothetical protein [Treponema sp.]